MFSQSSSPPPLSPHHFPFCAFFVQMWFVWPAEHSCQGPNPVQEYRVDSEPSDVSGLPRTAPSIGPSVFLDSHPHTRACCSPATHSFDTHQIDSVDDTLAPDLSLSSRPHAYVLPHHLHPTSSHSYPPPHPHPHPMCCLTSLPLTTSTTTGSLSTPVHARSRAWPSARRSWWRSRMARLVQLSAVLHMQYSTVVYGHPYSMGPLPAGALLL
jgi:hypothetical protein